MRQLSLALLLGVLALSQAEKHGCDDGWFPWNGRCFRQYYDSKRRYTYDEAEKYCASQGGHLATVTSQQELNFLGDIVRWGGEYGWSELPLIGIKKDSSGRWTYPFNNEPVHLSWCQGEPNNYQGKENCVIVVTDQVRDGTYFKERAITPCLHDSLCDGSYHGNSGYYRFVCMKGNNC